MVLPDIRCLLENSIQAPAESRVGRNANTSAYETPFYTIRDEIKKFNYISMCVCFMRNTMSDTMIVKQWSYPIATPYHHVIPLRFYSQPPLPPLPPDMGAVKL